MEAIILFAFAIGIVSIMLWLDDKKRQLFLFVIFVIVHALFNLNDYKWKEGSA